jgi:hypothetical protein
MAKRLPYRDGQLVAVPLRDDGGYAVGLIAAHDGRGAVVGYFFNQRFVDPPPLDEANALGPSEVLRVVRFGDLGLLNGGWIVIGDYVGWQPSEWPVPAFGRREPSGRAFKVIYSTADLRGPAREEAISEDECDRLPRDALSGSGSVERVLTHLLSDEGSA